MEKPTLQGSFSHESVSPSVSTNPAVEKTINLSPDSSVFQKFKTGLPELESGRQQGYHPFRGSSGELTALLF